MKTLGFIGMGNMAGAIAAGIIQKGLVKKVYPVETPAEERNLLNDGFISLKRDIINNLNFM